MSVQWLTGGSKKSRRKPAKKASPKRASWYKGTARSCKGSVKARCDKKECTWTRGAKKSGNKKRSPGHCAARKGLMATDAAINALFA